MDDAVICSTQRQRWPMKAAKHLCLLSAVPRDVRLFMRVVTFYGQIFLTLKISQIFSKLKDSVSAVFLICISLEISIDVGCKMSSDVVPLFDRVRKIFPMSYKHSHGKC